MLLGTILLQTIHVCLISEPLTSSSSDLASDTGAHFLGTYECKAGTRAEERENNLIQ